MGGTPERDGEDATAGVDVQPEIRFRCDLVNIALSLIMVALSMSPFTWLRRKSRFISKSSRPPRPLPELNMDY